MHSWGRKVAYKAQVEIQFRDWREVIDGYADQTDDIVEERREAYDRLVSQSSTSESCLFASIAVVRCLLPEAVTIGVLTSLNRRASLNWQSRREFDVCHSGIMVSVLKGSVPSGAP